MVYDPKKLIEKQKIEKEARKLEEKKSKRLKKLKSTYDTLREKKIAKINEQYEKKYEKQIKKIERDYETMRKNAKRKIMGKDIKKKQPTEAKIKQKAFAEVQKYSKRSRAKIIDGVISVWLVDKLKRVPIEKAQGGHVYSKHNYPQLAFNIMNIRPISPNTNRMQGENDGWWIDQTPMCELEKAELRKKKEDPSLKGKLRDRKEFEEIYEFYKKRNDCLIKQLKEELEIKKQ